MNIDTLKKWEMECENKKFRLEQGLRQLEKELKHVKALIDLQTDKSSEDIDISKELSKRETEKINKKEEIYGACKKRKAVFTTNDIKRILIQSNNEQIRNINVGYISGQLCKFAQGKKILLVKKGTGKGAPNNYVAK